MNIATLATIEEIQKVVKYPGRWIKPIVYTMESSGIQLRACNLLKCEHVSLIDIIRILILEPIASWVQTAPDLLYYRARPWYCN